MSPRSTAVAVAASLAIIAGFRAHATGASRPTQPPPTVRMQTTHSAESAPLNSVARAFRGLQPYFGDTFRSQRLTYRIHHARVDAEPVELSLKRLMTNIGGGEESVDIRTFTGATDETSTRELLAIFTSTAASAISTGGTAPESSAIPLSKFQTAANGLAARRDIKVFSSKVFEDGIASHVLLLMDEETDELLLLYVSSQPHDI